MRIQGHDVVLWDDGTLDTVLVVDMKHSVRFSHEEAAQYRRQDGTLTDAGFRELAEQAIEFVEENEQSD